MLDGVESDVRAYYDRLGDREWLRLNRHRVEYAITLRALRDHLQPHSRILDTGGGPGRYAVALASAGHTVTLLDIAPGMLARARDHAEERGIHLAGIVQGNATDLSRFESGAFDAVLLLGPLYHLPAAEDRFRALREARRVLGARGVLVAAFITRYAPLRQLARTEPRYLVREAERYETLLDTGLLPGPAGADDLPHGYYARWDEVPPLLEAAGFEAPKLLAAEGILDRIEDRVSALQGPSWEAWADLNYDLAGDPGLLAASAHLLAIAHRREAE